MISALTILLSVVLSGVTATIIASRLGREHSERELRRQKLEELYVCLFNYKQTLVVSFLTFEFAVAGKYSFDEAERLIAEDLKNGGADFTKIHMLIDLYFPNLRKKFDEIFEQRGKVVAFLARIRKGRVESEGEDLLLSFQKLSNQIDELAGEFLIALKIESDRLSYKRWV